MTASGSSSKSVAERFGFEFCTDNVHDIFKNDEINTVFIATRHDSHAELAIKAINAGKNVFVEKPLCLFEKELGHIKKLLDMSKKKQHQDCASIFPIMMVGYNRRFSKFAKAIKNEIAGNPSAVTYRINAGHIPESSWIQDSLFGGGRIIGEVCHFIDFVTFINGSMPTSVYARTMKDTRGLNDTVSICLSFENGSIGSISYFSNGNNQIPKERFEAYFNGCVAIIDDFKKLYIYADGKIKKRTQRNRDKGQKSMIIDFVRAVKEGRNGLIPIEEIINTSVVTFKIIRSIQTGQSVPV
jgi:polar amino acid transport system substrate-binding protein